MRRRPFTVLAIIWAFLTIAATLEFYGFDTTVGLQAHLIPATGISSVLDSMGLPVEPHGALVRSAHGPLFLGPLGFVICYLLPMFVFVVLARPVRHRGADPQHR